MQVAVTEQLKLLGVTSETDQAFRNLTETFASACDEVSTYAFEHDIMLSHIKMQDELYYGIRACFGLKAQLTISVFRAVSASYKALKTKLEEETVSYTSEDGSRYFYKKSLDWLEKPIRFSNPQADLVRGRDWGFLDGMSLLSIATLDGRVKLGFECREDCRIFDKSWNQGGAKLLKYKSDGRWYLHVSLTKEVPDIGRPDIKEVVGIDRGLVNIATVRDKDKTTYFDGEEARRIRTRYERTRASLQRKGTKGAKRVLKRLSGKENRWMKDVNHSLSKALVQQYDKGTLFVLEDLSDISFSEENLSDRTSEARYELRSWSFYDLEQKLIYKAGLAGDTVIKVDPHYTSQRCPACGHIDKESRHHDEHRYVCTCCGASYHDDEVAGYNLRELGIRWLAGEEDPCFQKQ